MGPALKFKPELDFFSVVLHNGYAKDLVLLKSSIKYWIIIPTELKSGVPQGGVLGSPV